MAEVESTGSAADFLPPRLDLAALRAAAAGCRGCALYGNATQTVFGEGPPAARIVLIGEQPGDQEDMAGQPFIGPAGQLLDRVLDDAELDREELYVTNAVKHFKWEPRGKRRLHKKPSQQEVGACRPWLAAEIEAVQPELLVCLGVTAATAAFGRVVRLKDVRGVFSRSPLGPDAFVTTHPSALLRLRGTRDWDSEYQRLVDDFRLVRERLQDQRRAL
jgi:uracil-DNA glycosylase family protein